MNHAPVFKGEHRWFSYAAPWSADFSPQHSAHARHSEVDAELAPSRASVCLRHSM